MIFQINIVVFASQAPTVSSDDIVLTEAETLIPVKIKNNSGLMGYKITVKYDKAKLQVCSVTKGDVSSKGNFITNFNADIDTFDIVWNNTDNVTKDGNLFVISAKAKKNASGKTEISLSYSQPDTFDVTYTDVRLECEDISVTFEKMKKQLQLPQLQQQKKSNKILWWLMTVKYLTQLMLYYEKKANHLLMKLMTENNSLKN